MSKPAQKARKGKPAVAQEPTPIILQPESASAALDQTDENNEDGTEEGKDDDDGAGMPQPDMFFSAETPTAAAAGNAGSSEMAMLTQQLQLMQQIIMMQQQQMQQQLQQHKAELEETKKLFLAAPLPGPSATPASPAAGADESSFTPFRTTVPSLPLQHAKNDDAEAATNTLRGRLGMVNDSIIAPSSRQEFSHVTEFQLGSRYVIKGLGLM